MIQLARHLSDVRILASASRPETQEWVRRMGAHEVVDHHDLVTQTLAVAPSGVDYLFTSFTAGQIEAFGEIVKPFGHITAIDGGPYDLTPIRAKSIAWHWELMFTRSTFQTPDIAEQGRILDRVASLVDASTVMTTMSRGDRRLQCRRAARGTSDRGVRSSDRQGRRRPRLTKRSPEAVADVGESVQRARWRRPVSGSRRPKVPSQSSASRQCRRCVNSRSDASAGMNPEGCRVRAAPTSRPKVARDGSRAVRLDDMLTACRPIRRRHCVMSAAASAALSAAATADWARPTWHTTLVKPTRLTSCMISRGPDDPADSPADHPKLLRRRSDRDGARPRSSGIEHGLNAGWPSKRIRSMAAS